MKTLRYKQITKANIKDAFRSLYNESESIEFENGYIALFSADRKRTIPQNAYYWGVVIKMLTDLTGYEPSILHEYLCRKFIGEKSRSVFDELIRIRGSSSDLTTSEFQEFIEKVRVWAFEKFGNECDIPDSEGLPISVQLGFFIEKDIKP